MWSEARWIRRACRTEDGRGPSTGPSRRNRRMRPKRRPRLPRRKERNNAKTQSDKTRSAPRSEVQQQNRFTVREHVDASGKKMERRENRLRFFGHRDSKDPKNRRDRSLDQGH